MNAQLQAAHRIMAEQNRELAKMNQELASAKNGDLIPAEPKAITPMSMLDRAVAQGASIETLEKLMALQERWDANQAKKAFDSAMAAAKADFPVIGKNRTVDFTSTKGRTHYRHEDLAEIAKAVDPVLARNGLSYRFRTTSNLNEPITVTCIVSHRDGHCEENTLSAGRDDSGNKNSIQGVGSTITYLQRYTLKAALGLAASNDTDARSTGDDELVTEQQIEELRAALNSAGKDEQRFCNWAQIISLGELPAGRFEAAIEAINRKKNDR